MASETTTRTQTSGRAAGPAATRGRLATHAERRVALERFVYSLTRDEAAAVMTLRPATLLWLFDMIVGD